MRNRCKICMLNIYNTICQIWTLSFLPGFHLFHYFYISCDKTRNLSKLSAKILPWFCINSSTQPGSILSSKAIPFCTEMLGRIQVVSYLCESFSAVCKPGIFPPSGPCNPGSLSCSWQGWLPRTLMLDTQGLVWDLPPPGFCDPDLAG